MQNLTTLKVSGKNTGVCELGDPSRVSGHTWIKPVILAVPHGTESDLEF